MTTNRLAQSTQPSSGRSAFRAAEWAQMARDKGRESVAKLWEEVDRQGWDANNYCPLQAEQYWAKIRDGQRGWS